MRKIAVSGYFDPIHVGHVEYINNAKKLAIQKYEIIRSIILNHPY